jgi:2,3-bisphosphoglycerate-dependent phosphoglycerate mutase
MPDVRRPSEPEGGGPTSSVFCYSGVRVTFSLVRHADAIPELGAEVAGAGYDALGLSPRGEAQAAALAARMRRTTALDAVYSSPALRARETAQAIAAALGLEARVDERLREVGMPVVTLDHLQPGERAAAVRGLLARFGQMAMRDGTWTALAGCEDPKSVRRRMRAFAADLHRTHAGKRVLAVSHAGSINAYVADVLGLARDFFFPAANTAISIVRIGSHGTMVVRLNDTAHLEGLDV